MDQRKHWRIALLTGICAGLFGCQDHSDPSAAPDIPSPEFLFIDGGDGGPTPQFASESEIPVEFWSTSIYGIRDEVKWYDARVEGWGEMTYAGNRGRVSNELSVLRGYSTVATNRTSRSDAHFWPGTYYFNGGYTYLTSSSCGQIANQTDGYEAKTVVLVNVSLLTLSETQASGFASAAQPECPPEPNDPPPNPPTGGGDPPGGGTIWCMVEIWYDMETGEILDIDILYCWVQH